MPTRTKKLPVPSPPTVMVSPEYTPPNDQNVKGDRIILVSDHKRSCGARGKHWPHYWELAKSNHRVSRTCLCVGTADSHTVIEDENVDGTHTYKAILR